MNTSEHDILHEFLLFVANDHAFGTDRESFLLDIFPVLFLTAALVSGATSNTLGANSGDLHIDVASDNGVPVVHEPLEDGTRVKP